MYNFVRKEKDEDICFKFLFIGFYKVLLSECKPPVSDFSK